jgi:hypothetical protein
VRAATPSLIATVVHQDSPDKYIVVDTVGTFGGEDDLRGSQGAQRLPLPARTRSAWSIVAAWFIVIKQ